VNEDKRIQSRFDRVERFTEDGTPQPVQWIDTETGEVTWRKPLPVAPVIVDGVIRGYSTAWVTCEPPVGERAIDRVTVTETESI
jgi:hypothetical protein